MDKQLGTWHKLVELAEMEMDNAAKTLAMMRQRAVQEATQLQSLRDYGQEYAQKGVGETQSVSHLNTYRLFADKLMQAIEAQQTKVEESEQMVEKAQEAWFEKRARFKALEQLLLKKQTDYHYRLDKQEQKFMDELAAQQASHSQQ